VGLIRKFHYPVKQYSLLTKDGYLLSLVRIPLSRGIPKSFKTSPGPPILLIHGIISSADDWVLNYPWNSPGFLLSDAGYDIWLLNTRGTPYSKHLKHHKHSTAYWDYSFDDIGVFDVTAGIDFVLRQTGFHKLTLIGWSQGSTDILVTLSILPEYNSKVKLFIALAPVANITHLTSPATMLIPFKGFIKKTLDLYNGGGVFPSSRTSRALYHHFCNSYIRSLCYMPVSIGVGISPHQLNKTRIPVYMAHMPSGTSTKNLIHFVQNRKRKDFRRYDYGEEENVWRYGTPYPPRYPLFKITAPVAIFWGKNDRLATPEDVSALRREIHQAIVYDYLVPDPQFAHLDFTIGINANHLLHDAVIHLLNKFHRGEHLGLYRPELHQMFVAPPVPPFQMPPLDLHKNPSGRPIMGVKFASIPMGGSWGKPSLPTTVVAPPHLPTPPRRPRIPHVPPSLSALMLFQPPVEKPDITATQLHLFGQHFSHLEQSRRPRPKLPLFGGHHGFGSFHHSQPITPHVRPSTPFAFPSLVTEAKSNLPDISLSAYNNLLERSPRPPPVRHLSQPSVHQVTSQSESSDVLIEEVDKEPLSDIAIKQPAMQSTPFDNVDHSTMSLNTVPAAAHFVDYGLRRTPVFMHPDTNGGFQTDWFPIKKGSKKLNLHDLLPSASTRVQSKAFVQPNS
ncbi:lipase member M-like, partial [Tropilaelaps mercedesae]